MNRQEIIEGLRDIREDLETYACELSTELMKGFFNYLDRLDTIITALESEGDGPWELLERVFPCTLSKKHSTGEITWKPEDEYLIDDIRQTLARRAENPSGWIKIEPGCEMPSDCELVQLTVVYNKPRPHNKPETWCGYSATGDSNDPQWTECDGTRFDDPHPDDPDWDYRAVAWKPLSKPRKSPSKESGGNHE